MTKTGVLTRSPIYHESQISPQRKTGKRELDESNSEDLPSAKQRKITDFRIP